MELNSVLTEKAYDYILDQILNGVIIPGDRIREDLIAEQLGMSRTPVREAINQLSQNGFINYIKRKGLYCVQLDESEQITLLNLRENLEAYMYIQCIHNASKAEVEALKQDVVSFLSLSDDEKMRVHSRRDIDFHIHAARLTHSKLIEKYVREIETLVLIVRKNLKNSKRQKDIIDLSWKLHGDIADAIQNKDEQLIRELNHEHIQLMRETQLTILK